MQSSTLPKQLKIVEEIEVLIQKLIFQQQFLSQRYLALASTFQREEQSHTGTEMFFWRRADKVRMDARRLMRLLVRRGSRLNPQVIPKPDVKPTMTIPEAMCYTLQWEQEIMQTVNDLVRVCFEKKDLDIIHVQQFLLTKQRKLIKHIADNLTILKKSGTNLGESLFDEHVMKPLEMRRQIKIVHRLPRNIPQQFVQPTYNMTFPNQFCLPTMTPVPTMPFAPVEQTQVWTPRMPVNTQAIHYRF